MNKPLTVNQTAKISVPEPLKTMLWLITLLGPRKGNGREPSSQVTDAHGAASMIA